MDSRSSLPVFPDKLEDLEIQSSPDLFCQLFLSLAADLSNMWVSVI